MNDNHWPILNWDAFLEKELKDLGITGIEDKRFALASGIQKHMSDLLMIVTVNANGIDSLKPCEECHAKGLLEYRNCSGEWPKKDKYMQFEQCPSCKGYGIVLKKGV